MNTAQITSMLLELQKNLFNFAYSLTMNREDAQDLLQATSLKVLNNSEKFVNNDNMKGWIFTIMRNIFINDYHKSSNRNTIYDNEEGTILTKLATNPSSETPDSSYTIKEINRAIKNLNDEYRIPFNMYVAGYKYQEIADKMHLPIGTVKSRIYSSRQRLQSQLRDYQYEQ